LARLSTSWRIIAVFAATSLAAVSSGAIVCALSHVPSALWGRNLLVWGIGALAAVGLTFLTTARWLGAMALMTPLGIAGTMAAAGQLGVHRWLDVGPIHLNAAMLLLPGFVVALAALVQRSAWWWGLAGLTLPLLVLQPDASQATALALAVCAIALGA
jgi:hypothetical protein